MQIIGRSIYLLLIFLYIVFPVTLTGVQVREGKLNAMIDTVQAHTTPHILKLWKQTKTVKSLLKHDCESSHDYILCSKKKIVDPSELKYSKPAYCKEERKEKHCYICCTMKVEWRLIEYQTVAYVLKN
ncbi:hypothetical protein KIN20_027962 [Parelaphostrongylus tenuis]|uniref:Uncharacterized protein n=1 Tax=Parelaphostrongylus tenuis TaxID=148309 RepID=A0AAD5R017_PARTN|nr:hypothetical protein KIN20_027962 [Parelaphostrongylus tenuis]